MLQTISCYSHMTLHLNFMALPSFSLCYETKTQLHLSPQIKHPKSLCHITGKGVSNNISGDWVQAGQQILSGTSPVTLN